MADFEAFLAGWNAPGDDIGCVQVAVTPFGNINSTGELGNYRGPALPPRHPQFEAVIEPGVRQLVLLLVRDFAWVTYTSCQGHSYPGGSPSPVERHVGLAPRSQEELRTIIGVLESARTAVNRRFRWLPVRLEVLPLMLESGGSSYPVVDLFFRRCRFATWKRYFIALDRVYEAALAELAARCGAGTQPRDREPL